MSTQRCPLTDSKAAVQQLLAKRMLMRRRLLRFTQETHPSYSAGWVHEDICRRLEKFSRDVTERKSPRLMLLMPPRAGKSELASIRFPAWHLGHNPSHEIINVGYNLELPMRFSRRVREVVRDPIYGPIFPDTKLDPESQSVEAWNTTAGGGFTAAGVGGGITGKGCFSLDTAVETRDRGIIPMRAIRVGDHVYAYDHKTRVCRFAEVLAIHAQRHAEGTSTYAGVRCTADHPLFTPSTGDYTPALDVEQQDLLVLRRQESSARGCVQELPSTRRASVGGTALSVLPEGVLHHERRGRQASPPLRLRVLFTKMRRRAAEALAYCTRRLSALWGSATDQGPEDVLRTGVLRRSSQRAELFRGLHGGVSSPENAGVAAGRVKVCVVEHHTSSGGASHRSRPDKQLDGEPHHIVEGGARALSRTPGTDAATVSACIERTRDEPFVVIDLQTDTGNLFADGVLAHNCHILLVDDPIKNQEEADSVLVRDRLWDWYQSTAYTRLAPGGGVLCIETFWSDDDLAGRLMMAMAKDPDADQFEIVKYPALSEAWEYRDEDTGAIVRSPTEIDTQNPPLGYGKNLTLLRPIDTCLHEARYPTEALKRIRSNLQPRIWSALYQQNPVPDEGLYFRKEFFKHLIGMPPPTNVNIYTAWDFAIGEKQQNDWTVGATIMQDENDNLYVLEIFRMKGDSFQIVEAILATAARWGSLPGTGYLVGAEDGQIWRAIEPLLKKLMSERRQYFPYEVLKPLSDKLARARPLQGRMQQGRVFFPQEAPWLAQAEHELLRFPAGAHDDVVDALAWCVRLCLDKSPPARAEPPRIPSWRDKLASFDHTGGSFMAA